jgi:hypothetical protein
MNEAKIKSELRKLLQAEETLLVNFALDSHCTKEELCYISAKIFEMSTLILKLRQALKDMRR